jgi:hypothetical protein
MFATCNVADNNPNYNVNINYPDDIEGLWTYIYYSYGKNVTKAVGFAKFGGDGAPQRI